MNNKISIVIPAYNEEKIIGKVISKLMQKGGVEEIVVIDNASTDNTSKVAKKAGAIVVNCSTKGKGHAMREGVKSTTSDIIVFLDADINNYSKDIIKTITNPIIQEDADFVKTMFERKGGRVTELVAKPMLSIFFPDIYNFSQPLSGMVAGKREFFEKIEFENDYGVDIGILLDMIKLNAKIIEVHIGKINNNSQPLKALDKMSKDVIKTILKKAGVEYEKDNSNK